MPDAKAARLDTGKQPANQSKSIAGSIRLKDATLALLLMGSMYLFCSLYALLLNCSYALLLLFLGQGKCLHYTAGGQQSQHTWWLCCLLKVLKAAAPGESLLFR